METRFDKPLTLSDGRDVIVIATVQQAGQFLLNDWPPKRRRRPSYRMAVTACVRAMAQRVEPEVARQALLAALVDLWGKNSPVKN